MCGILAIFNSNINIELFKDSLKLMNHRGPDFSRIDVFEDTYLGHNRLSILDLNPRSNQPFKMGEHVMVFNGEVYNYKELISQHKLDVKTKSDTEVILLMYIKYGPKCLHYFNGMFAIIIYNVITKEVFAARDRLGIKPLYYREKNNEIIFSSEVSSILKIHPSGIDEFGLRQYKKLRMTLNEYTFYKDIKMFLPGYYYLNGKMSKYWELDMETKKQPSDDEIHWLIKDSIRLRKRSDVSIGSYLSGGLDSTILTAVVKPDHTWTVGFETLNEFEWSEIANERVQSIHHQTIVDNNEFILTAKKLIHKRKEPLSVPNEVLIYLMTKNVKKHNTVILSGEGADELFLGYDRIFRWANHINNININEFDEKYSYGSHKDDEVIDYALEGLSGNSSFQKICYFFQIHHLHGLLRRLDNSTMMCSVEARVPFVDHRLIELISGTPFDWRMGNRIKDPLKRIFKYIIPEEIIMRKKVGFPVPLESVFVKKDSRMTPMDAWLDFNIKQMGL